MTQSQGAEYPYTCISSGPDWLTATAKSGSQSLMFREIADEELQKEMEAGGNIKPASMKGYVGRRGDGFFYGHRHDGSCIILSGPRTPPLFARVAQAASHVSRLDLQATIWTHGDTPHIGLQGYNTLKRLPPRTGRKPKLTFIQSEPAGETLNVNSRSSDNYGRCYDYGIAHKFSEARTLWRYEVEFKRETATSLSHLLSSDPAAATTTAALVHDWWLKRGVQLQWKRPTFFEASSPSITPKKRDVLTWFDETVSVTIAKSISRFGLSATLRALHLDKLVQPITREED